ncbi:MAG: hypothetical protein IIA72_02380 [Proteobacteria bacterium]|nr:hypothetical protein [Pseudomonadota bacterium]
MIFGRRIKRQQAMARISDPLVHKSKIIVTELLKKQLGEETKLPVEILWFSMWLVYLAFSTAKPYAHKKERQSLNDAYNQIFTNLGVELYQTSELASKVNLNTYVLEFSRELMKSFMTRVSEYDDAFNMDKGVAFAVPDNAFGDFVPSNLLGLSIRNIYGEKFAISEPSKLDKDFIHGFMAFFTNTLSEAARDFENLSL